MKARVEHLMRRDVATCRPDDHLNTVACIMWERDCGIVPVTVEDGGIARVVGIVTDRDVCMAAYTKGQRLCEIPVSTTMSRSVRACGPKDPVSSALKIMATAQVHRIPVIDDAGGLVGILSLADAVRKEARSRKAVTAEDIVTTLEAISAPRAAGDLVVAA